VCACECMHFFVCLRTYACVCIKGLGVRSIMVEGGAEVNPS